MVLTIFLALIGAALGAFLRPRVLAVAFAAALSAGGRGGALFITNMAGANDESVSLAGDVIRFLESPFTSYLVLISACAGAATFAGLLCLLLEDTPSRPFWMPVEGDVRLRDRNGRYIRAADMIEERAIHNRAEAAIRRNFER